MLQRERDAVNEWLASNKTFHNMRDHPWHGAVMLAGMWGGWNRYNDKYRVIRQQMLDAVNPIGKVTGERREKKTDAVQLNVRDLRKAPVPISALSRVR